MAGNASRNAPAAAIWLFPAMNSNADGLTVIDYKTDAAPTDADVDSAVARYRLQAASYAVAVTFKHTSYDAFRATCP